MYNERIQQSEPARHGAMRPSRCRCDSGTRDIPIPNHTNEMQGRRNCDGSLRNEHAEHTHSGCANGKCGGWGLEGYPVAMVYSPCQAWRSVYTPDIALSRGTMFSELDLPFESANHRKGGTL